MMKIRNKLVSWILLISLLLNNNSIRAIEAPETDSLQATMDMEVSSSERFESLEEEDAKYRQSQLEVLLGTEEPEEDLTAIGEENADSSETDNQSSNVTMEFYVPETEGSNVQTRSTINNSGNSQYELIAKPQFQNKTNRPDLDGRDVSCYVSNYSGDLQLNYQDISLPGRNGLDLNVNHFYSSELGAIDYYNDTDGKFNANPNNYYLQRYGLGLGWSFNFPSVEVISMGDETELYYHIGDGAVYHVDSDNTSNKSHLKNYYAGNVVFSDNDTSYTRDDITSAYSFKRADNTMEYFSKTGEILAIVDRYGNAITFDYVKVNAESLLHYDSYPSGTLGCYWSKPTITSDTVISEQDNYLTWNNTSGTVNSNSLRYISPEIELDRNIKEYYVSFLYNAISDGDTTFSGDIRLSYSLYDEDHTIIATTTPIVYTPSEYNQNIKIEETLSTNYGSRNVCYAKINIDIKNGINEIRFDDIRLSPKRNMISTITDTVGRTLTFEYTGDPFERYTNVSGLSFPITISVKKPDGTEYRKLQYARGINTSINHGNGNEREISKYFYLTGSDNGDVTSYVYYKTAYTQISDNIMVGKGSCTSKDETGAYYGFANRPVIDYVTHRNSATFFEYEEVRKGVGDVGFIDTVRVSKMYEKIGDAYMSWGTPINETTYQYNQGSYKDETYYQAGTRELVGSYIVTVTNPSGSLTSYYYAKLDAYDANASEDVEIEQVTKEITKESSDSNADTITTQYEYNSTYAVTSPSKATITEKVDGVENTTVYMYEYDANTSEIKKESLALTSEEISGTTIPTEKTIQYTYKKITNTINGVSRSMYLLSSVTSYMDADTSVVQQIDYDALGNIISAEDGEGNLTEYAYEDTTYPWLPTKVWTTDPENKGNEDRKSEIQYIYSGNQGYGLGATKTIQLNGTEETGITENDYDIRYGDVIAERIYTADNKYNEVTYTYNDIGLCTQVAYPTYRDVDGEEHYLTERYFYKTQPVYFNELKYREVYMCIDMESVVDDSSSSTEWESSYYDDYGNLVFVDSYVDGEETYDYDSALRVVGYQNRRDYGTEYKTLTYTYDGFDRITKVTDRLGNEYQADYKLLEIKYAFKENDKTELTNEYSEIYDNQGQVIKQRYYYDDTLIDTVYTYDYHGNVTSVTDGNGKITSYEYDKLNQPIKVTQADGSIIETAYAKSGAATEVIRTTDDDSYVMANRYDDRGQLREISQKGSDIIVPSWKYRYRMDGVVQSVTDPNGTERIYGYDSSNHQTFYQSGSRSQYIYYNEYAKPSKIVQLDNQTVSQTTEYTYNVAHKLTKKNVDGEVTQYRYDDYDSLMSILSPDNHCRYYTLDEMERIEIVSADASHLVYEYTGNNLVSKISYSYADIVTTYQYDDMNRLTKLKTTKGTESIVEYRYTYDNVGNVLSVSGSENYTYTYDDLYRLKTVVKDGVTTTYEYDSRNNLISEVTSKGKSNTYQYSGDNRLIKAVINGTTVIYEYDLNGNLIADSNGNEYAYDEDNRLIYSKVDGVETSYTIGVDGYRKRKQSGDDITTYSLDEAGHVISETDGYGNVTEIVWDGARPVTREVDGKYYYYVYNGHGDVVALVDEEGTVQNEYSYSPWGEQTVKKESIDNPIGYTGEYQDRETGLTYLRARYYNPSVRRFIQEDPARDQWDWYVYCNNNPINYKDSTGLDAILLNKLVDSKVGALFGIEHTSAFFQNDKGEWYYFSWEDTVKYKKLKNSSVLNSLDSINTWLRKKGFIPETSAFTESVYIKGDFSASQKKAKKINDRYEKEKKIKIPLLFKNRYYNLFLNNCSQVATGLLCMGTLPSGLNVGLYILAHGYTISMIPNINMSNLQKIFYNTATNLYGFNKALSQQRTKYDNMTRWKKVKYAHVVVDLALIQGGNGNYEYI